MTTNARVAANRENARKSTGPRTAQGKRISARNALKHGFRANLILDNCILAEHESPRPFGSLLKDLVKHLQPVGPLEEFCVETIATCMWRLRRVVGEEHNLIDRLHVDVDDIQAVRDLDRDPDSEPELILYPYLPKPEDLMPLLRYERHLSRERRLALRELRDLQAIRLASGSDLSPDLVISEQQKMPNEPILTPHPAQASLPSQDLSSAPASNSCDREQSPRPQLSTPPSAPNEAILTSHPVSAAPASPCLSHAPAFTPYDSAESPRRQLSTTQFAPNKANVPLAPIRLSATDPLTPRPHVARHAWRHLSSARPSYHDWFIRRPVC